MEYFLRWVLLAVICWGLLVWEKLTCSLVLTGGLKSHKHSFSFLGHKLQIVSWGRSDPYRGWGGGRLPSLLRCCSGPQPGRLPPGVDIPYLHWKMLWANSFFTKKENALSQNRENKCTITFKKSSGSSSCLLVPCVAHIYNLEPWTSTFSGSSRPSSCLVHSTRTWTWLTLWFSIL